MEMKYSDRLKAARDEMVKWQEETGKNFSLSPDTALEVFECVADLLGIGKKSGPIPKYPTHPGVLVKQELEAKNQSISAFIGKMEKYGFVLAKLINEKADIDKHIAEILEKELGISADYWIRLQDQYDKDMAQNH